MRTSCSPSCRCSVGLGSCLTVESRTGFSNAYLLSRKHSCGHFVDLFVAEQPRRSRWPADEEGFGFFKEGRLDHAAQVPAFALPQRPPNALGRNPHPEACRPAAYLHGNLDHVLVPLALSVFLCSLGTPYRALLAGLPRETPQEVPKETPKSEKKEKSAEKCAKKDENGNHPGVKLTKGVTDDAGSTPQYVRPSTGRLPQPNPGTFPVRSAHGPRA